MAGTNEEEGGGRTRRFQQRYSFPVCNDACNVESLWIKGIKPDLDIFRTDLLRRITQEAGRRRLRENRDRTQARGWRKRARVVSNVSNAFKSSGGSCDSSFQFIVAPLPKLFTRIILRRPNESLVERFSRAESTVVGERNTRR